jgi:thiol-disulfide isomerase/thioredoxin
MKRLITLLCLLFVSGIVSAQTPATAEAIMTEASGIAKAENKKVFIMFHASWCGWCHKMDAAMNEPEMKKFFDDSFVIRHLVVLESGEKKNLENPGASEMMKKYYGDKSGIPYWLIFDANVALLADSKIRPAGGGPETGNNVGCPASEAEVAYFIDVLKKTTKLKEADLTLIAQRFRKNESGAH